MTSRRVNWIAWLSPSKTGWHEYTFLEGEKITYKLDLKNY